MPQILDRLDERCFLGFPIWEFSFRSLLRQYGRTFLRDIVLRHPLRTLNGLLAYRRHFRQERPEGDITALYTGTETDLKQEIIQADGRTCRTETLPEDDYRQALLQKLVEEAQEAAESSPDRLITELASGRHQAGHFTVTWNGRNSGGVAVGSGVYFVRLEADGAAITRKMVLMK